jgi:hypothetical protein
MGEGAWMGMMKKIKKYERVVEWRKNEFSILDIIFYMTLGWFFLPFLVLAILFDIDSYREVYWVEKKEW